MVELVQIEVHMLAQLGKIKLAYLVMQMLFWSSVKLN